MQRLIKEPSGPVLTKKEQVQSITFQKHSELLWFQRRIFPLITVYGFLFNKLSRLMLIHESFQHPRERFSNFSTHCVNVCLVVWLAASFTGCPFVLAVQVMVTCWCFWLGATMCIFCITFPSFLPLYWELFNIQCFKDYASLWSVFNVGNIWFPCESSRYYSLLPGIAG